MGVDYGKVARKMCSKVGVEARRMDRDNGHFVVAAIFLHEGEILRLDWVCVQDQSVFAIIFEKVLDGIGLLKLRISKQFTYFLCCSIVGELTSCSGNQ